MQSLNEKGKSARVRLKIYLIFRNKIRCGTLLAGLRESPPNSAHRLGRRTGIRPPHGITCRQTDCTNGNASVSVVFHSILTGEVLHLEFSSLEDRHLVGDDRKLAGKHSLALSLLETPHHVPLVLSLAGQLEGAIGEGFVAHGGEPLGGELRLEDSDLRGPDGAVVRAGEHDFDKRGDDAVVPTEDLGSGIRSDVGVIVADEEEPPAAPVPVVRALGYLHVVVPSCVHCCGEARMLQFSYIISDLFINLAKWIG